MGDLMLDEQLLLERAADIARPFCERTAALSDDEVIARVAALARPDSDPLETVSHALGWTMTQLRLVGEVADQKPTQVRCAWCAIAAGDTAESWAQAEYRTPEDGIRHALSCGNSPLVRAAAEFALAFNMDSACDDASPRTREAFVALRKMLAP